VEENWLGVTENLVAERIFGVLERKRLKALKNCMIICTLQQILFYGDEIGGGGSVWCLADVTNVCKIFVRKPEGKRPFQGPMCGLEDDIKCVFHKSDGISTVAKLLFAQRLCAVFPMAAIVCC
jgi:hypothetical protein